MQRVFLAIPVPNSIARLLINNLIKLDSNLQRNQIRFLGVDQLHITVHFFGDVDEVKLALISEKLHSCMLTFKVFDCKLKHITNFPRPQSPVIAAYVQFNLALMQLHSAVQNVIRESGSLPEERAYKPHITLCRMDRHSKIELEPLPLTAVLFKVNELVLYQSKPSAHGSQYLILQCFKLCPFSEQY